MDRENSKTRFDHVLGDEGPAAPAPRKKFPVVVQKWEETEAGWGTRPDGYSLHLTEEDRAAYVKEANERQHAFFKSQGLKDGQVPHEYDRVDGDPYLADVDEATYLEVQGTKNGLRKFDRAYPGNAGRNGWKPVKGK